MPSEANWWSLYIGCRAYLCSLFYNYLAGRIGLPVTSKLRPQIIAVYFMLDNRLDQSEVRPKHWFLVEIFSIRASISLSRNFSSAERQRCNSQHWTCWETAPITWWKIYRWWTCHSSLAWGSIGFTCLHTGSNTKSLVYWCRSSWWSCRYGRFFNFAKIRINVRANN